MITLTVSELIEDLKAFDGDMPVVSCINYGDRSNTMQAVPTTTLGIGFLERSGYSETGFAVVEYSAQDKSAVVVLNHNFF